ncbi:MAG TPA: HAD-IA family hydrolase [Acidimicrobiales bacterium]|nr:HAD-IA family hydrolase [Acidimicrobiales bacterium]
MIRAAFFDFGGVVLSSPFDAFARYEHEQGLPEGFIRGLNATNPDTNAWAQLERNTVPFEEFCRLYEREATDAGQTIDARQVIALLSGEIRPAMVEAIRRCGERLKTACLTNNIVTFAEFPREATAAGRDEVLSLFDVIVESSKVGVRKPDLAFYEMACELVEVDPTEVVFLDDLGINLKPARAMGMTTIKVGDPAVAIAELEAVVGFPLS